MGCRLKSQHAFSRTSPTWALKAPTIVAEGSLGGLNLGCLLLYGANLLVGLKKQHLPCLTREPCPLP